MNQIIIEKTTCYNYPKESPFRPDRKYPESPFEQLSTEPNEVYDMVRNGFRDLGYDRQNYGSTQWNPLGKIIKTGDTVLLKPNLVMDINRSGEGTDCLYTNPSVVAAVLDYVYIALKGKGHIVVGDAPMQECKFERLIQESGYDKLIKYCNSVFNGVDVHLIDFRDVKSEVRQGVHYYAQTDNSQGVLIDLGPESEFVGMSEYSQENMRITNYDPDILKRHHCGKKHEYLVNRKVLEADVIINLPKPKTHRKAGITAALKNLVGINARKEFLPHHTDGSVAEGGDEYLNKSFLKQQMDRYEDKANREAQTNQNMRKAKLYLLLSRINSRLARHFARDDYQEGSWYGNHTISRTITDLNKILFYADKNGKLCDKPQRKYLIVADMIISGEKEGPVMPSPKEVGIIAMGENPVAFDSIIGKLMGADIDRIPTLQQIKESKSRYRLGQANNTYIVSNDPTLDGKKLESIGKEDLLYFIPTSGWKEVFAVPASNVKNT